MSETPRRRWWQWPGALVGAFFVGLIRMYQRFISPLTGPSCRYYPSCSAYAVKAIQVHGPIKGVTLGTWRILKCNPFTKGGVDPVPAKGRWQPYVFPDGRPRPGFEDKVAAERAATDAAAAAHRGIRHNGVVDSESTSPTATTEVAKPAPPTDPDQQANSSATTGPLHGTGQEIAG